MLPGRATRTRVNRPAKPVIGWGVNPPGEYSSTQRFGTIIDTFHPSSASRT
jgi:hypothetical protein